MPKKTYTSPISLDLGAKNTGAHFACYEAGSKLADIRKSAEVYQQEHGKHMLWF